MNHLIGCLGDLHQQLERLSASRQAMVSTTLSYTILERLTRPAETARARYRYVVLDGYQPRRDNHGRYEIHHLG